MESGAGTSLARALEALGVGVEDMLERLHASVVVLDSEGHIVWQNAVSVSRVGNRRGVQFLDVVAPEHRAVAERDFMRLRFNPDATSLREIVALGPGGARRRTMSFSAPFEANGHIAGVVALGIPLNWRDETEAPRLAPRLVETLELLTAGRSTREIASELGVTIETARNYIRRLFHTLDVHSRVEAVARGRELRLVTRDAPGSSEGDER